MQPVRIGIIGSGNVGAGTLEILSSNAAELQSKLGFPLQITAVSSQNILNKKVSHIPAGARITADWREVVFADDVDLVCELIGGTTTALEIIRAALSAGKPVVTANKELMALQGSDLQALATAHGATIHMEASVAGGIPIHSVLREGISADSIVGFFGILNGTSNYILTEIEAKGSAFEAVLADAQKLGYAEADPTADVEGYDARSKLALLAQIAFGQKVSPTDILCEGIRRITPFDFEYAHTLGHTIRLVCAARKTPAGLALSVRPTLIPKSTILASVLGAYNAIWVRGAAGQDTFYYGRGAGPLPTGVAVVSDIMRAARDLKTQSVQRCSPFSFLQLRQEALASSDEFTSGYYLRFRVRDTTGIIAALCKILAENGISIDAVLQLPSDDKSNLPFVITVEHAREANLRNALSAMSSLDFLVEEPLALPLEKGV
ncbi:homoserine dehydrogenase [Bryobacter aggregatus]|uniref:homoserine dehydrogenase n=1 Tax=Bryobacter aggregatus TaxID=360054 RepID=UPI0004E0B65E|nr:homoserine dehydrogenase [Bryobacter aggregatus]